MKSINSYINEKLILNRYSKIYFPKTRMEISAIIDDKINENEKKIYVGDIDISNLVKQNIGLIFSHLDVEEIEGLERWDVSNIMKMYGLFKGCEKLKNIKGIENWDVSNCDRFDDMFKDCKLLTNLDLSNWNVRKSADTHEMFNGCNMTNINKNFNEI